MKKLLIILGSILLLNACSGSSSSDSNTEYLKGYGDAIQKCKDSDGLSEEQRDSAYNSGYTIGYEEGYNKGHEVGYSDCRFEIEYPGQG